MKNLKTTIQQANERIESNKIVFRQHQRNLPFTEKMQIAFARAERDETIRTAVLLPKKRKLNDFFNFEPHRATKQRFVGGKKTVSIESEIC